MFHSHPERLPARFGRANVKIPLRAILFSLVVVLLLGLAIWNRTFFVVYFIEPIARVVWLIYRTFLSIDQETYWILLILVAVSLAILTIPNQKESSVRSAYRYSTQENDRVVYWETLLKSAIKSGNDQLVLQRNLETLQRSISGQSIGNDEEDVLLPPFKNGFQQRIQTVWNSLPFSKIGRRKEGHQATELEKSVGDILEFMETQLEIHHD